MFETGFSQRVAYYSDGSINSRNELVLVRERYLGGASVTSRNCLSHRRRNWTESRSTKFAVTRMVKLQMQAFGRVAVQCSKESFDGGQVGGERQN